jgi:hypothetical protein
MRDENPVHPAYAGGGKDLVPLRARRLVGEARVDDRPALAVFQQPKVDVIERERQGHAQPVHARRDAAQRAGRRRFCKGKLEGGHAKRLG